MREEELNWLQEKYRIAVEFKAQHIHMHLRELFQEYRGNSLLAVADMLAEHLDEHTAEYDTAIQQDGRVPILNVLVRKAGALLTAQRPFMTVLNRSPRDEAIAELLSQNLESRLDDVKFDMIRKRITIDALLSGTGVAKVGYDSEMVYGRSDWADKIPRKSMAAKDLDMQVIPYGAHTEYTNRYVKRGGPLVLPVRITDIFFDSGTRSLFPHGPAYVFHRTTRRLVDVLRDSRYSNAFRAEVSGKEDWNDQIEQTYLTQEWNEQDDMDRQVDMIECYSNASREFCVFTYDCHEAAIDWTPMPLEVQNPYHYLQYIPDPESPYGIPYAGLIAPAAKATNFTRAVYIARLNRDGKTVHLYDSNRLNSLDKINELNRAKDGGFVGIPGLEGTEPGRIIQPLTFGGVSPELLGLINMHRNDADYASGMTEATRNSTGQDQTATEVQVRQEQQNVSVEDMRFYQEEFTRDIAEDMLKIMLQYWDEQEIVKVTGNDPRIYFYVPVERERVRNDFTLRVILGSSDAAKSITNVQQAQEIARTVAGLNQQLTQERMLQMQGVPPGPLNIEQLMRMVLELSDRRWADACMRRQDPMELMARLLQQHNMAPIPGGVSPMLQQLILQQAKQRFMVDTGQLNPLAAITGGKGGSFEAQNRTPAPIGQMQMEGQPPGRVQSEMMGAAV